jgi:hypothetical protein
MKEGISMFTHVYRWIIAVGLSAVSTGCIAGGEATESAGTDDATTTEAQESGSADEHVAEASEALSLSPYSVGLAASGGSGGSSPVTLACPGGSVATGIYGWSGAYVDKLGLWCSFLYSDGSTGAPYQIGALGGNGGGYFSAQCPKANEVVVGLFGYSGAYINQIGIECSTVPFWITRGSYVLDSLWGGGLPGPTYFEMLAPHPAPDASPTVRWGAVITRLDIRSGAFVDQVQPFASYINP